METITKKNGFKTLSRVVLVVGCAIDLVLWFLLFTAFSFTFTGALTACGVLATTLLVVWILANSTDLNDVLGSASKAVLVIGCIIGVVFLIIGMHDHSLISCTYGLAIFASVAVFTNIIGSASVDTCCSKFGCLILEKTPAANIVATAEAKRKAGDLKAGTKVKVAALLIAVFGLIGSVVILSFGLNGGEKILENEAYHYADLGSAVAHLIIAIVVILIVTVVSYTMFLWGDTVLADTKSTSVRKLKEARQARAHQKAIHAD